MKKKCVIYGAGTYGEVYNAYLSEKYEVVGYIDDDENKLGSYLGSTPILGNREYLFSKLDKKIAVFVPIGNNNIRRKLLDELNKKGFNTPCFIHQSTQIHPTVSIGKAVYILPTTCIMPYTNIGDYTMISMGVNFAHHLNIEKGCFFSQGCNIGASVHFKEEAYCGIASTVMTNVKTIGRKSLIGAGAVIIRDIPDGAKVVGNPGRIIK